MRCARAFMRNSIHVNGRTTYLTRWDRPRWSIIISSDYSVFVGSSNLASLNYKNSIGIKPRNNQAPPLHWATGSQDLALFLSFTQYSIGKKGIFPIFLSMWLLVCVCLFRGLIGTAHLYSTTHWFFLIFPSTVHVNTFTIDVYQTPSFYIMFEGFC